MQFSQEKILTRRRPLTKFGFFRAKTRITRPRANVETSPGYQNQARPILHNLITLRKFKLKTIISYEQKCEARI